MKYKWKINDLEEYIKLLKLKLYNLLGIKDINKIDTDTLINISVKSLLYKRISYIVYIRDTFQNIKYKSSGILS